MNNKSKRELPSIVYVALLILFLVPFVLIRTIDIMNYTDFSTGFFNGPNWIPTALLSIVVVFVVLVSILVFIDNNKYTLYGIKTKHKFLSFMAIICSVFSFINAIISTVNLMSYLGKAMSRVKMTNVKQLNIPIEILSIAFGFLTAIAFIYFIYRIDKTEKKGKDIIMIFPCLWACFQVLSMFLDHMMIATVHENMINILRAVALCIFLLSLGKITVGFESRGIYKWLVGSSMLTFLFGMCATLPQYFRLLIPFFTTGQFGELYSNHTVLTATPLDFAMTLFTGAYLIYYLSNKRKVLV